MSEPITNLPDAVADRGALPMPVGPVPQALSVERLAEIAAELGHVARVAAEATGWRLEDYQAVRGVLHSARLLVTEAGLLRARVAELEAEQSALKGRLAELEDMTPAAIQTCRVCGAGYTFGESCSVCAFQARMAAETVSLREREPEFHAWLHHENRLGHDLPETGGAS
jgi:hypothetical protein